MDKKKKDKNVIFGEEKQKNIMNSNSEMSRNVTGMKGENYSGPTGVWEANIYDREEEKRGVDNSVLGGKVPGTYNQQYVDYNSKKEGLGPNTNR